MLGVTKSATARKSVDFPQPDGPSKVSNSPRSTSRLISDSAVTLRWSVKKRTLTLRQVIAVPSTAGLRESAGVARLSFAWAAAAIPIALQALIRASRVAFKMSSVITSSSFGVRFENCPSCE